MRMYDPENMGIMCFFRRIDDEAAKKAMNGVENLRQWGKLTELDVHPIGKLPRTFFLGHGFSLSADSRCVVRFLSWLLRRNVRVALQLQALLMQPCRARGRHASPPQWWLEALDERH